MKSIEFINDEERLIIKSNALNVFKKYEQKERSNESGGILLGYVYQNRIEIAQATVQNKYDQFGPFLFIRSKKGAQPEINKAWRTSYGSLIYLGEWHTHPEVNPRPSFTDKKMIIETLKNTKMEIDFLCIIIIGLGNTYFVGKQTKQELIELKLNPTFQTGNTFT